LRLEGFDKYGLKSVPGDLRSAQVIADECDLMGVGQQGGDAFGPDGVGQDLPVGGAGDLVARHEYVFSGCF
jgi:hypothetical protein